VIRRHRLPNPDRRQERDQRSDDIRRLGQLVPDVGQIHAPDQESGHEQADDALPDSRLELPLVLHQAPTSGMLISTLTPPFRARSAPCAAAFAICSTVSALPLFAASRAAARAALTPSRRASPVLV